LKEKGLRFLEPRKKELETHQVFQVSKAWTLCFLLSEEEEGERKTTTIDVVYKECRTLYQSG